MACMLTAMPLKQGMIARQTKRVGAPHSENRTGIGEEQSGSEVNYLGVVLGTVAQEVEAIGRGCRSLQDSARRDVREWTIGGIRTRVAGTDSDV